MAHNPMGKDPADYESEPIFNATTQKLNIVNTRTGLFEAYLKMLSVIGNSGSGPVFELDMFYSPLTNNQAALGDGWEFSPTIYSEEYKKLTLNTGETLALEKGEDLKQPAVIAEWGTDEKLTVYRKGGRTEILSKLGESLFYLPESLTTDGYNFLYMTWIATPHVTDGKTYYQTKLQSVRDSLRTLLKIEYTLADDNAQPAITPVTLTYWPDDPAETLRYELTIEDYALKSVALAEDIKTTFEYLDHETAGWLLNKVTGWEGLTEELEYSDDRRTFPDNPKLSALPCVSKHYMQPTGGGTMIYTLYTYSTTSDLKSYITTSVKNDSSYRSAVEYKYDRDTNEILLETTTLSSNSGVTTTATNYTISPIQNAIKNEHSITYTQQRKSRKVDIHNSFNQDAALIENKQRNRLTTFIYQRDSDDKFQSNYVFQEIVESANLLAPAISTKNYLYSRIDGLRAPKLRHITENLTPLNILNPTKTTQTFTYYQTNDFRKGKPEAVHQQDNVFISHTREFEYTLGGTNNTELTTKSTEYTDHANSSSTRTSSNTQSILSGRLIRQVDTDGNQAEYTYDAFGRLSTHTLCAQIPTYKQTTTYTYPAPGQIKVTEPNGQVRLSEYDGQDRLVREYDYVTADTPRLLKEISYDALGRENRSTQYDYRADGTQISDWSEVKYGGWGEISGRRYSDGREDFNLYDPIEMKRSEWTGKPTDKHRKVTTYNLDETIKKIELLGQNGAVYQTQTATYTPALLLERLVTDGEFGITTINYTYDPFGRVLTETHSEKDKGLLSPNLVYSYHYTYSPHSTSQEPETIEIHLGLQKRLLGSRTFDEWDRVTTLTRGNATETYTYDGASPVPASTKTADGTVLKHEYIKELGNKPSKVSSADGSQQKTFTYAYAKQSLSTASEGEHFLQYNHDLNLRVNQQRVQTQPGEAKEVSTRYSPAGRLLSETDVLGASTEFRYNDGGQRFSSRSEFFTTHAYTGQGQLAEEVVETRTGATKRVEVSYTYDAEQRETSRRFVPLENTPVGLAIATAYYADGKFKQVQLKKGSAVLGSRSFTYSAGGRLKSCTTTGVWRPKNPKGTLIDKQEFTYDGLGNVTQCISTFAGVRNTATYTYDSSMGVRLEKITNTHADYTKSATLRYDAAGRVTQDQNGKKYTYDWLGRLTQVGSSRYTYDPSDRLMTHDQGPEERQIIYNDLQVNGEYALGDNNNARQLQPGSAACTAQRSRVSGVDRTLYEWRDLNGTVWVTYDAAADTTKFHAYSPYGEHFFEDIHSLLGANGELDDSTIGQYPLGCGYRFLNPETRQFNAPDSLSPFGKGGTHAYGYCTDHDPINFQDPSGHFSANNRLWESWGGRLPQPGSLGEDADKITTFIFSGIGVLTALMTGGATLLLMAGLAAISATLAIASVYVADIDKDWSAGLAWASLVFGVAGGAWTLGRKIVQRTAMFARYLGNSARTVGKAVFQRTAAISPAQKVLLGSLGELPENMSPTLNLRLIEPFPFNTRSLIPEVRKFDTAGDLNTVVFGITGVLGNTGILAEGLNELSGLLGNGTWLPNGNWGRLWTKVRR